MAGLIEWAVAGEVTSAQLAPDVLDRDRQAAGEQIIAVAPNRFGPAQLQRVGVAPLCRSSDDDGVGRESGSLATRPLQPMRHRHRILRPSPAAIWAASASVRPL